MPSTVSGDLDREEFLRAAEAYRGELIAHCYRMVGSAHEAEDLVQETYLRAWRGWEAFEGRASTRNWLYRIATNLCLTAVTNKQRRVLPSGLGPAAAGSGPKLEQLWLEPFPERWPDTDPAEIVAGRSSLRLALVASLQHLPPRQRAVFILREVLAYPAAEVADMLGMSLAATKSALQRARAKLDEVSPRADAVIEPDSPHARALLERYLTAFENADVAGLTELLRDDAILESTATGRWLAGKTHCIERLLIWARSGEYRLYPVIANGQPAMVAYRGEHADPALTAFGVVVLAVDDRHVTHVTAFIDPGMVRHFGFPEVDPGH
ncbi:RNA polymerase subunit sigma-70 [Nocardia sp. NPDC059246]|uniref:RNA polymerase subunit sigma-70 n=1 Tax=unclassified Nocardia TaxID=2637762 RepID=UPI0036C24E55